MAVRLNPKTSNISSSVKQQTSGVQTFAWSDESMRDAIDRSQLILVSSRVPEFPATESKRISILDIPQLWGQNPDLIFQTGYRIAGLISDVTKALEDGGVDENDIQEILDSAITYQNHNNEMRDAYNDEYKSYTQYHRNAIYSNTLTRGYTLIDIAAGVNPNLLSYPTKSIRAKITSVARGKRVQSLQEKINTLPEGKVIDVSRLNPDGTGATKIPIPPSRSSKRGTPDLPIVSSDFQHYVLAIRMLPNGETVYQNNIDYMKQVYGYEGPIPGIQPIISGSTTTYTPSVVPAEPTYNDLVPLQLEQTGEVLAVGAKSLSTAEGRRKLRERKEYEKFLATRGVQVEEEKEEPPSVTEPSRSPLNKIQRAQPIPPIPTSSTIPTSSSVPASSTSGQKSSTIIPNRTIVTPKLPFQRSSSGPRASSPRINAAPSAPSKELPPIPPLPNV